MGNHVGRRYIREHPLINYLSDKFDELGIDFKTQCDIIDEINEMVEFINVETDEE